MKSCHVGTQLLIQTQKLHQKKEMMIRSYTENNIEPPQDQTSVEPKTNPIEITQHNPEQIQESSYSEIFHGQVKNPFIELKQQFFEVSSSEQTQSKTERLRL